MVGVSQSFTGGIKLSWISSNINIGSPTWLEPKAGGSLTNK